MSTLPLLLALSSACAGGTANPAGAQADAGTTCDRRCLLQVLRAYTEALTDNEVFKVQDGLIRHIHAFFRGNGQQRSGWGEGPGA